MASRGPNSRRMVAVRWIDSRIAGTVSTQTGCVFETRFFVMHAVSVKRVLTSAGAAARVVAKSRCSFRVKVESTAIPERGCTSTSMLDVML